MTEDVEPSVRWQQSEATDVRTTQYLLHPSSRPTLMAIRIVADTLVTLVALMHAGFLVLEMFFWNHPVGRKVFRHEPEFAARSATLAANQGLYNGFLAAGLVWGLVAARADVMIFFLSCVVLAGIYGGFTVKRAIFFTQGVPAILALGAVLLAW